MMSDLRIPVTVLTGFLGSGKTTLLQRLLNTADGVGAAVLINELGEVGIDHLLVRTVTGPAVVLQNGCICCTVRADLRSGLRDLIDARDRKELFSFDRILVETTGLADPVPIVQTLMADPMLRHQLRLANLVSTVDGRNGLVQLDSHDEALRQAAVADRLVVTKGDICDSDHIAVLRQRLETLNPTAAVIDPHRCDDLWSELLGTDAFDPQRKSQEVRRWFAKSAELHGHSHYDASIHTFVIRTEQYIDWTAFAVWLSAVVHRHGQKILRIKGLLNVLGSKGPVVLNAVQRFIHPPLHLEQWPDCDHSSRLVFIVQGLDATVVRQSLERFLSEAAPLRQGAEATV